AHIIYEDILLTSGCEGMFVRQGGIRGCRTFLLFPAFSQPTHRCVRHPPSRRSPAYSQERPSAHSQERELDTSMEDSEINYRPFNVVLIATQIIGAVCVAGIGYWGWHHGGYDWHSHKFNYHPLFMIIGLVFLYANGALLYRTFRTRQKKVLKLLHAFLLLAALVFAVVGLVAIFQVKKDTNLSHISSLHGWMGIATVILFASQWLCGFLSFLIPATPGKVRGFYLPIHQVYGVAIFLAAVATCLLGILEHAQTAVIPGTTESRLVNVLGLLLCHFAGLVVYLVAKSKYKRHPIPEERPLLGSS
ncbi:unnamed protein product, partial [Meganyctiphanes norvegica]